jgi:hypothetical protein
MIAGAAPGDGVRRPTIRTAAAAAAMTALTIAIYFPALGAGFVGDDFMILHRLRALAQPTDALRFFRGEFFEYYRPLPFVSFAIDWSIAGANARQFHLTNLLLHTLNAVLVLLIGRALSPRSAAGPIAGLLFALHASNHEAVVWMSARFDLLATAFSLAAIWWMVERRAGRHVVPPLLFFAAILSKESAVALPVAAAGFAVFRLRAGAAETVREFVPWLAALAVYGVLRNIAGGVSAIGGAGRLPKLAALIVMLAALVLCTGEGWATLVRWIDDRRRTVLAAGALGLVILAAAAAVGGGAGRLAADKLAVAGFVVIHLVSPVLDLFDAPFYLAPDHAWYWRGGVIALAVAGALVVPLWRAIRHDGRVWFLGAFLAAALLPISALTEGARYLYLPSAAVSLIAGLLVGELAGRRRRAGIAMVAAVLIVSTIQISVKVRDWVWAGQMTAEGARLVDAALAPSCGEGHVVFLTAPVAIRAVYTNFYYETFELPRGCMPGTFHVLARMTRVDGAIDAEWRGASQIVITAPAYRDNFVLSHDLRHFDRPIRGEGTHVVRTPLGEVRAERTGAAERLTLTLDPGVDRARTRFFYFGDGRIRPLPPVN